MRVSLLLYAYLIIVEGLFDELTRILFFFTNLEKGVALSTGDLSKVTVRDTLREIQPTPIFLKDWDEKNHIRNAIGHARAYYREEQGEIHFVDIKPKEGTISYDKTIQMRRFMEMAMELEETVEAFYLIMILLRLHDLILSKNPYAE